MKRLTHFFLEVAKIFGTFFIATGVALASMKETDERYDTILNAFGGIGYAFGLILLIGLFFLIIDK